MKHLGDISKINGAEIEPVDCIVGGSPCQDLSVAGLRKGLQHESKGDAETTRSGLFIEQIRVTKELRKHDRELGRADQYVRPRYFVWENVPGALSSNKGEDFRCVLEETARIVQEDAVIPKPTRGGWSYSGCIMGKGYSIAWRVTDAQYWGVPQRRRRICLLADFNGYTASDILFDPQYRGETERTESDTFVGDTTGTGRSESEVQPITESLCRDSEQSRTEREEVAGDSSGCIGRTGERLLDGWHDGVWYDNGQ